MASFEGVQKPSAASESDEGFFAELLYHGTDLDDLIFYGEDWTPSER